MKKFFRVFSITLLAALISSTALAQTQTGTIRGVVNDDEGNVLPGATVIINSPVMMAKNLSVVTGPKGGYRFPALTPGTYELKVQMSGFKTIIRPGIIVSMNATVTINISLEPTAIEEKITVIAASPTVDLKATNVGQSFKTDYLDMMPNARDLWTVIQEAPGMIIDRYNVGGSESGQQSGFSAFGASGRQKTYNIDGVNTTDMAALGASSTYYSYDSFEEIQISTSSHSAELGPPGVALNIITKSGSNEFHGDGAIYYSDNKWQADNLSEEHKQLGITHGNPMDYYLDYSINIGGPIFKDKLWFWGLRSLQKLHRFVLGFEYEGKPYPEVTDLANWIAKLDWQVSKKNKVSLSWNFDNKLKPNRNAGRYVPPEASWKQDSTTHIPQVHWTSILSDNAFLDIRLGAMYMSFPLQPPDQVKSDHWPVYEYRTVGPGTKYPNAPYLRGYHYNYYRYMMYDRNRLQGSGFLDYYIDDFMGGSHEFKIGFQISKFWSITERTNFGPRLGFRYGKPYNIRIVNTPLTTKYDLMNYAFYVQDSYVLWNRLTLNFGLRFETYEAYLPDQSNPESAYPMNYFGKLWDTTSPGVWNSFKERSFSAVRDIVNFKNLSPRIGIIYDVFGNGKTAVKASYSRYYWQMGNSIANFVNKNGRAYAYFKWHDDNGDLMWQPGEEASKPYYYSIHAVTKVNPNLKNTYTDEVTFGVETEILKDFSLSATFVWRQDGNLIDDIDSSIPYSEWHALTFTDYGPDGIKGTSDDGTFKVYEPNYQPRQEWYVTNPEHDSAYTWPVKNNRYRGVVIRAHKRFSNRWQLLASLTLGKSEGMLSSASYATGVFDSPNADLFAFGPTYWDRPVILKISGSYQLPLAINVGTSIRYQSGQPFSRTHETPVSLKYIRYITVPVEPRSANRYPGVTIVDIRAEKFFRLPGMGFLRGEKISFFVDVFNLFNANTTTSQGALTSDTYKVINAILAPRILRLGVKFSF